MKPTGPQRKWIDLTQGSLRIVIPHSSFVIILALSTLVIAACGERISDNNLKQVHEEMSPKEVESILGQPTRIEKFQMEVQTQKPVLEGQRYYYEQNGKTIELHFVDGKLISRPPLWSEQSTGAETTTKKP